jgi:hypothetical protein
MSKTNDNNKDVPVTEQNNVVDSPTDNTNDSNPSETPPEESKENTKDPQIPLSNLLNTVFSEMLFQKDASSSCPLDCECNDEDDSDENTEEEDDVELLDDSGENTEEEDDVELLGDEKWQAFNKLLDSHLHVTEVFLHLLKDEE